MRVLFLTHRVPYPPNRGDRIRAWHLLGALREFAETHVLTLAHDEAEAAEASRVASRAAGVTVAAVPALANKVRAALALPGHRPLTHVLLDSPRMRDALFAVVSRHPPDVVIAYCSGMARFALEPPLAGLPFVLDMVDVDSLKWQALAARSRPPWSWVHAREAVRLGAFERRAALTAAANLVVSSREGDALARIAPGAKIHVVENGIDLAACTPPEPAADKSVVFTGVFDYAPNEDGALWFGRDVWPLVRARHPGARFWLVGMAPTRRLRQMASRDDSVVVTGSVPDVVPYLWRSAVNVAPIFVARGTQNKVLQATASGLPSVVTPAVFEGLPAAIRPACLSASDPLRFASAVIGLLDLTPADRRARARQAAIEHLTWAHTLSPLREILTSALGHRREPSRALPRQPAPLADVTLP